MSSTPDSSVSGSQTLSLPNASFSAPFGHSNVLDSKAYLRPALVQDHFAPSSVPQRPGFSRPATPLTQHGGSALASEATPSRTVRFESPASVYPDAPSVPHSTQSTPTRSRAGPSSPSQAGPSSPPQAHPQAASPQPSQPQQDVGSTEVGPHFNRSHVAGLSDEHVDIQYCLQTHNQATAERR